MNTDIEQMRKQRRSLYGKVHQNLPIAFSLSKDEGWRTDFNERNYPYYTITFEVTK